MSADRKKRGIRSFTLLEMLMVMGIMGLLFAMLMPGIGAVRRAAQRNRARQEIASIHTAMLGFLTEYGRYPLQKTPLPSGVISGDSGDVYGRRDRLHEKSDEYIGLIDSLRGRDAVDNPRNITFLNITERSIDSTTEQYVDPWMNRYAIVADWNMDGNVFTGNTPNYHGLLTNRTVAVWSWGQGGQSDKDNPGKHITSWEKD